MTQTGPKPPRERSRSFPSRRAWRRVFQAFAVVGCLLTALFCTHADAVSLTVGQAALVITVVVTAICIVCWGVLYDRPVRRTSVTLRPTDADLDALIFDALDKFDPTQFSTSALTLLAAPAASTPRISQSYTLTERHWTVVVIRTVLGEHASKLAPVHRSLKGEVVGRMKVEADGARVRTLQHDESRAFLVLAIEALLNGVLAASHLLPAARVALTDEVLRAVVSPVAPTADARQSLLTKLNSAIDDSTAAKSDRALLQALTPIVVDNHIVFAELPNSATTYRRLQVEYDLHLPKAFASGWNRLRVALGLGLRNFRLPIPLVFEAASYHLDVTGPEGMYVYNAYTATADPDADSTDSTESSPHAQLSNSSGDNVVHFYARNAEDRTSPSEVGVRLAPQFVTAFREVPPGLLGSILVVSLWFAFLAWIVGIYHNTVFPAVPAASSWPALIFGVPAVLTGWVISKSSAAAMRASSIGSFALLAWLAVNAGAVVVVVALKSAGVDNAPLSLSIPFLDAQTIEHPTWTALMVSTGLCFFFSLFAYSGKTATYISVVNNAPRATTPNQQTGSL